MNGWLKGTPRTQSDRRLTSADEGKYDHGYLQEQHDHQDRHQKGPGQENGTEACCEESRNQGRRTPCGYDARACHPREIDHGTALQIHDSLAVGGGKTAPATGQAHSHSLTLTHAPG